MIHYFGSRDCRLIYEGRLSALRLYALKYRARLVKSKAHEIESFFLKLTDWHQ